MVCRVRVQAHIDSRAVGMQCPIRHIIERRHNNRATINLTVIRGIQPRPRAGDNGRCFTIAELLAARAIVSLRCAPGEQLWRTPSTRR
ncbi:hypothetical protein EVAR_14841_1 [Eumeta japonica]|uniref:Uncharacterized protein n=1 Tax=Eumeta variegata TaxID=151549 RepID=A0A4C1V3N7_EUMVA|nr:hypothetical protein EVAR_14841_1 [Eumeta japonica]